LDRKSTLNVLADRIVAEQASHPLRVAIDGRTASGKTTLADEIALLLHIKGRTVIRTSVDGFHRPRAERYRQGRFSAEGYLDDARDWTAVRQWLLGPLGPGGNLPYRTSSFDLDLDEPVTQDAIRADPDAILIVDGTFLQRPELAEAWDFVIFVEVSKEVAIQRGVRRDAAHLGGEANARVSPEEGAHLVVENDDPSSPNLR
jgi:uridine kinase